MSLLITFYGDDFTGSTDVMESLSLNGIPTALFLDVPDPEEAESFRLKNSGISMDGKLMGFGVAGVSRSLSPRQMDDELPSIFDRMTRVRSTFFHYKICSTFDSAPHIGNIGHAVDIALRFFPSQWIPLIVGIPFLNRYCVFGNLFARVDGVTYRIDRHPTMSKHPVTPLHEADIRLHLAQQTSRKVHLVDVIQLENDGNGSLKEYIEPANQDFVLFDVLRTSHLGAIGKCIIENTSRHPQLLVGSSGVEYALCEHWQQKGVIKKISVNPVTKKAPRYMVVAGSCSPGTARQLEHGFSIGYHGIRMDSGRLIQDPESEIARCISACLNVLESGGVPVLFSALGPDDPAIAATHSLFNKDSDGREPSVAAVLGGAQGRILKEIIDRAGKLRVTVAGGDTSGFVSKALRIYALEVLIPVAPGAPLCLAHARDKNYDGLEIALKGGQNGNAKYFESVQTGRPL